MMIKNITFITIIIFITFISSVIPALAAVGHSVEYQIGSSTSSQEKILGEKLTVFEQVNLEEFNSRGYFVRLGFPHVNSPVPFSFSLSDLTIDFGILSPGVPAVQSNNLTISTGGAADYQVVVFANHPLKSAQSSTTIPDTSCDDGLCNETRPRPWTSNNVYGFGFNASGSDVVFGFVNSSYYRQFANKEKGETPQLIISRTTTGYNPPSFTKRATITYKVNIADTQKIDRYGNEVIFVATPKY